jgi:glycosyltransferase involved in cell wall biosynthesis
MASAVNIPVVSVLLPVFNAEMFVRDAVESILAQTFRDFELIIINDGSQDGSEKILRQLMKRDARVILISRENRGLVYSLNEGIGVARGKWIARMDADDISLPNRLEAQLSCLQQTGADICGSWVKFFGSSDRRTIKHPQSDAAIKLGILFGSPFAHPSVVMRAALAKQLQYDKSWEKCEDYDLWERAARSGWIMANVPHVLLLYRQHDAQISSATAVIQQKLTQEIRHRYWTWFCDEVGLDYVRADSVLQMRMEPPYTLCMNDVDFVFEFLLQSNSGESRQLLLEHLKRLYFRVAGDYPDIVSRWAGINSRYGSSCGLGTKLMLLVIAKFHIRAGGKLFNRLKRIFLSIMWRS